MAYMYHTYAADAGANDTYTITLPNFDLPAYITGMEIAFKANTVNTGAATLNVNSLGAKSITKNGTLALGSGDIPAGAIVTLRYDGTQFQLQGAPSETGLDPTSNFLVVPNIQGLSHTGTGNAFTAALNDTITVFAVYLERALILGEAAVGTGTLGGSCAVRTFGVAFYNSSLALVDTTAAIAWPGNGTGGAGAFAQHDTVGPGLVWVGFTTYNDGSCTQIFRGPDLSTNTVFSGILASIGSAYPIVGYATTSLDVGLGWPATITLSKATTAVLYPNLYITGTTLD